MRKTIILFILSLGVLVYAQEQKALPKAKNPKIALEIYVGEEKIDRLEFELRADMAPKTVENFLTLCKGSKGYGFKNTVFHRIIPGFMMQGGDFTRGNGTGGHSIWGEKFPDENFRLKHTVPGLLSMANSGPNTNGSQFFITFAATTWLDGKHVVFGRISNGAERLEKFENFGTGSGNPTHKVELRSCEEIQN